MNIVIHKTEYNWPHLFRLAEAQGYGVARISRLLEIHENTLHNIKRGVSSNPAHETVEMLLQMFEQILYCDDYESCLYKRPVTGSESCDNKPLTKQPTYDWSKLMLAVRGAGVTSNEIAEATGLHSTTIRRFLTANATKSPRAESQRALMNAIKRYLTFDEINRCRRIQ